MEQTSVSVSRFLKTKLEKHQQINPSYSLRAFAVKIGISPGGLVQVLSGKKRLSAERAHVIADALKLSGDERKLFLLSVEFELSKRAERKAELFEEIKALNSKEVSQFFDLSVDQFRLISDWSGLAIFECVSGYGRTFSEKELARHFGLTSNEVSLVLDRLNRLELIEKDINGNWVRSQGRVLITSNVPNEAIRNYYRSVAHKSLESYGQQTPQEKVSACEVFTFDVDQLDEVRKLTDEYLDRILALAKKGGERKATYQAVVNVFRLTKEEIEIKKTNGNNSYIIE